MEQTTLFPMATHVVKKLTDYAVEIRGQIIKLDEAIDKKKGEIKVLRESLEDIELAIKEAGQIHLELTPPVELPAGDVGDLTPAPDPRTSSDEGWEAQEAEAPAKDHEKQVGEGE